MQLGKFFFLCVSAGLMAWLGLVRQSDPAAGANKPETFAAAAPAVAKLVVPEEGRAGFKKMPAAKAGLVPKAKYELPDKNEIRETGNSGLAAGDVDGDGLPDLFVCGMGAPNVLYRNKGNWQFEDITAQAGVACRGWRLSGAVFGDVDGDGDLDLVTVSLRDGRNFLFLNDGRGKFTESLGIEWVVRPRGGSVAAALADIDGDGDLDLYVTGFVRKFLHQLPPHITSRAEGILAGMVEDYGKRGQPLTAREVQLNLPRECAEHYTVVTEEVSPMEAKLKLELHYMPDTMYLNDGRGNFRAVTDADARFRDERGMPMPMPSDPSHEPVFRDVDGDGDPDLYVCSDFFWPDRFWINEGRGTFRLVDKLAVRRTSQFSMGVGFADINRDGHQDFLTVDMLSRDHKRRKTQMGMMQPTPTAVGLIHNRPQIMQNTFFLNRGDNTWAEIAQFAGVKASEWSWGTVFMDVDLDGYEDLLISTGMTRDFMDSDAMDRIEEEKKQLSEKYKSKPNLAPLAVSFGHHWPKLETTNVAYRNRGDLTFEDVSKKWGFGTLAVSGGIARADFDGDGDLDVIINNDGVPLEVYRNETTAPRIAVRLMGNSPNTQAIGAKVRLLGGPGGPEPQQKEINCGGGYASGSDTLAVFGTADRVDDLSLEITWRNGRVTRVPNVRPNNLYTVRETDSIREIPSGPAEPAPLFASVDHLLAQKFPVPGQRVPGHIHHETAFDDFKRQSLLPNRLSQLGPAVAWTDVNGDGHEDLIIGTGAGGRVAIYHGRADGKFTPQIGPEAATDTAGLLGWTFATGKPGLLIGQSNFETDRAAVENPAVRIIPADSKTLPPPALPGGSASTGPLAVADVDNDGDLDLFVGGRTVPGRYPEPADSRLYLNNNGTLEPDPDSAELFKKLGLVSGAVLGDLDNDGDADLVLALEWGPVKVFRNHAGKYTDATATLGLAPHQGWWNSVALGDLDGDGRLDIVAGNWGLNSKYEGSYSPSHPLRIAYGDFDNNGVLDIVEYHRDKLTGKLVPERGRSCSMNAMPFIGEHNGEFSIFGGRTIHEVYKGRLKEGTELAANILAHTVFFNRGGKFEPRPLPALAQFAPVFGINIADFNGDGHEDIFVAQNFFASQIETPRSDGGRGLLLLGDGDGGLKPMPGHRSGLLIYGEQRGSAVGDFDADGRPDLVVTQNGTRTRLFRNTQARPGLRVHLDAGDGNPTGIGAIARLKFGAGKPGPARLVTAGSGYWSQDAATLVLALPTTATHIEVRWPGGKVTTTELKKDLREITINAQGKLTASK